MTEARHGFERHCFTNLAIMAMRGHEPGSAKMEVVICDALSPDKSDQEKGLRIIHCYIDNGDGTVYDISRDPFHKFTKDSFLEFLQSEHEIRIPARQAKAYWDAVVRKLESGGGLPDMVPHPWKIVITEEGFIYHCPNQHERERT